MPLLGAILTTTDMPGTVGGTDVALADGGTGSSTALGARTNLGVGTGDSPAFSGLTINGDAKVTGVLDIEGGTVSSAAETVRVADNHLYLNDGYTTAVAQSGGLVVNYLPTATNDTIATGGFTAGVASTSNPTVKTTSAAPFAAGDLIQISGANTEANNGLYEVLTSTAGTLTIRGVGTTAAVEDFTQNQFVTDTNTAGAIRKVTVAVLRAGTDGAFEVGSGAVTSMTFNDLYRVGGTDVAIADGGTGSSTAVGARTALGLAIGTDVQAWDADLDAVAALDATAGYLVKTGAAAYARRTLTGTANQVTITNGDGTAGNPVFATPQDIHSGATPQFARLGLGAAADASDLLALAQGTITTDKQALEATATWNAAGVTFTALRLSVTDTASAAGSLLIDLQVGAASKFKVDKAGKMYLPSGAVIDWNAGDMTLTHSAGTLEWQGGKYTFTMDDNLAQGFRVVEAGNAYLEIDTSNSAEALKFGNAGTNPAFTFNGSGTMNLTASWNVATSLTHTFSTISTPSAGYSYTATSGTGGVSASATAGGTGGAMTHAGGTGGAAADVATGGAGAGGKATWKGGVGGAGVDGVTNDYAGAVGGDAELLGGLGGAGGGSVTAPGAGGAVIVAGGAAGTGGTGNAGGGAVLIRGGAKQGSGTDGNVTIGATNTNAVLLGSSANTLGFFGGAGATKTGRTYTPTNVVTDRSYDANATTVDEIADVLGSLIADLQAYGLVG